jgi:hypothetical protein
MGPHPAEVAVRGPSYVISPNRLAMTIVKTKVNAGEEDSARSGFFTMGVYFGVNCARS